MKQPSGSQNVASPCIAVCVLDAGCVCTGCGRHIDEIANWAGLSDSERREVNVRAQARRNAPPLPQPSVARSR
jgi:predicted Fe-S protein YdhL (DUF1289 family)